MSYSRLYARLIGLFLLVIVLILDQWSKAMIEAHAGDFPIDIFSFFSLVLVHNHGVSFGFMGHTAGTTPIILTSCIMLIAFALFIWFLRSSERGTVLALGLVLGGALGNISDRLRFGAVTDFLDFHIGAYHWPAFNIADSAICIGVVILVLLGIVGPVTPKESTA